MVLVNSDHTRKIDLVTNIKKHWVLVDYGLFSEIDTAINTIQTCTQKTFVVYKPCMGNAFKADESE